jgi:hypothetical protein
MARGSIRRRGRHSWQVRFDDSVDAAGRRRARWATGKGTRHDAQRELTRLLAATDAGMLSKITVIECSSPFVDNPWMRLHLRRHQRRRKELQLRRWDRHWNWFWNRSQHRCTSSTMPAPWWPSAASRLPHRARGHML